MKPAMPFAPMNLTPTYEQLMARANPQQAGVPETTPWWLYDTQTFTDNVTTELTFFAAPQSDRTLSNIGAGGSLPDPQFLTIYGMHLDVWQSSVTAWTSVTAAATAVGVLNDMGMLMVLNRPVITLTVSGKDYGPWPATIAHATGGPTGGGYGTLAAAAHVQFANNGILGNGAPINGFITIPPRVDFSVRIKWGAAVDTTAGDYRFRVVLYGLLARAVK